MNKNYYLITYGCQMNKSDSERIGFVLEKSGYKKSNLVKSDLVILNLCSVRQSAIDRVWGMLKNIKIQEYKNNKKITTILTGCILQDDKKKFRNRVDYILDINKLSSWPEMFNLKNSHINSHKFASKFACSPSYQSSFLAYVPVMNGCNNYCSYCVVPYTRGREKSRPTDKILKEVNKLIVQGYKHIILLGQNVNSYCLSSFAPHLFNPIASSTLKAVQSYSGQAPIYKKNRNSSDFAELLKQIDQIPGNYWLSFITSHPKDLSDDLIKCFKNCQHLIPYLHLPIQSGSNKILKDMNRKYTTEKYLKLIEKIRKTVPDINLSTDIIVGFPNETKKDFNDTIKVMKKAKFDMAYIAQYSPRPGTAASKLKDNVSKTEKKTREKILTEILKKTALENNKKMMGKIVDVLIENRRNEALPRSREYFGRTRNFKNIKFTVNNKQLTVNNLIGKFVKVKITKINPWNLEGKLICNADL